jgi:hypothetical protein
MNREEAAKKLRRMVQVIESGELPATILGLYVFGSYARGALAPNDLDLILCYGDPDPILLAECKRLTRRHARNICEEVSDGTERFERGLRKRLRKPGEKMDVILAPDLAHVCSTFTTIPRDEIRLIWSPTARDVEASLRALPVDADAARAPRHQFISPKRIQASRDSVEMVTEMLDAGELALEQMDIAVIAPVLKGAYLHRFEHWTRTGCLGRDAKKCLPYAVWWLQSEKAGDLMITQTEIHNKRWTRRAQVGRLHLGSLCWHFGRFPKMKRQCLIPFIKRSETNELLVFERGPNWKSSNYAKIEPWSPPSGWP